MSEVMQHSNLRRGTSQGRSHSPVVYYMTSEYGGVVKIGTTVNLVKRLHNMNRGREVKYHVLGIEPGSYDTERQRHLMFKHISQRSDFFWATPELLNHIASATHSPTDLIGWALEGVV